MVLIYLTLGIAFVGLAFLIKFGLLLKDSSNAADLKRYRDKSQGFTDLLIYGTVVDDGVILCKNGCLMAAWEYSGEDIEASTDSQREAVSQQINKAFGPMGSGWMVHIDACRETVPGYSDSDHSFFPSDIPRIIDEERRDMFQDIGLLYEGKFVITLTWYPPLMAERKFVEAMFDDDFAVTDKKQRTKQIIDSFKHEIEGFEYRISSALKLKRLKSEKVSEQFNGSVVHDKFLEHIKSCVTGINSPVVLPKNTVFIDSLIGGQDVWSGVTPKIGRNYVQVVSIDGLPFESSPGILNALSEIPISYRWSSRFIFLDRHEAIDHLSKFRDRWKQKERGFWDQVLNLDGPLDQDAVEMVNEAGKAIADVNGGLMAQGYYTSVVVLMDEDRNKVIKSAMSVKKLIDNLGFTARIETINAMDALFGSFPGHGYENVRRPLINTLNFADLIPVNTIWTGDEKAPCPYYPINSPPLMHCFTSGNSPFRLNLHVRDLGHSIIFGPTRAGKSTLLGMIALQFLRYAGAKVFCFDKGMAMYPACQGASGIHYDIGESDLSFAPLSKLDNHVEKAWALEWIEIILALNGLVISAPQRNEIARALDNMSKNKDRTLSEFIIEVQDLDIKEALKQYSVDGFLGYLMDAEIDNLDISNFTVFEIEKLMSMGEKNALPVLLYLFHRIERALDGSPTMIIIDEAWLMLAHPVFKEKIREWLKSIAKKNCSVVMATQNLSDAIRSGILDVINESTATKIFLANPHATEPDTKPLYQRLGLNDKQIELIQYAVKKRDYYFVSEKGSRMFQLALGKFALAFVGKTDLDSIEQLKLFVSMYGNKWVEHWYRYCGIEVINGVVNEK